MEAESSVTPQHENVLASLMSQEEEDEFAWEARFASTQRELECWAEQVRVDIAEGRVVPCRKNPVG
jgi:hypothetical protein